MFDIVLNGKVLSSRTTCAQAANNTVVDAGTYDLEMHSGWND